jgi:hypothetical protein
VLAGLAQAAKDGNGFKIELTGVFEKEDGLAPFVGVITGHAGALLLFERDGVGSEVVPEQGTKAVDSHGCLGDVVCHTKAFPCLRLLTGARIMSIVS